MNAVHDAAGVTLLHGDVSSPETYASIPDGAVQTIVTSPPYFGLRDYGEADQIGAEPTVGEYVAAMVAVFRGLRRVLADDGTVWLNLGDSYAAKPRGTDEGWDKSRLSNPASVQKRQAAALLKRDGYRARGALDGIGEKNLIGVPWRVALALQEDGWVLRSDVVWHKPNPMPESVTDRPTKSHEYLFLLAKSPRYFYDAEAIAEPDSGQDHPRSVLQGQASLEPSGGLTAPHRGLRKAAGRQGEGRNKRSVWTVPTVPFSEAHFAVYPPELIRPCIRAGSRIGDLVLDPFSGSGTTGMVAREEGRRYVGIDLNREYLDLSLRTRFAQPVMEIWGGAA